MDTVSALNKSASPPKFGNYGGYYSYRKNHLVRLNKFPEKWFKDKCCLDVGCNSGELTNAIASKFQPQSILGVDRDAGLIKKANRKLLAEVDLPNISMLSFKPRALSIRKNVETGVSKERERNQKLLGETKDSSQNTKFVCVDFVSSDDLSELGRFDTITCLSVTKWVHMGCGDEGLITLFSRIFDLLQPGGHAIIEYQGWASYTKKKKISEGAAEGLQRLNLRPEGFETALERLGFEITGRRGPSLAECKGFDRPILLLTRPHSPHSSTGPVSVHSVAPPLDIDQAPSGSGSTLKKRKRTRAQGSRVRGKSKKANQGADETNHCDGEN
jgi:7SK snRNA methylphosphate capping enzyme